MATKRKQLPPALTLTDVDFSYAPHLPHVLHDVSLTLAPNTITAIIGASGSGKSTILRLAAGLIEPTTGSVERPLSTRMIFQNGALLPWLTAYDNVAFSLLHSTEDDGVKERRILKTMKALGVLPLEHHFPRDLSGGERQRVGIARALVAEPELLLLDEPFSALDHASTTQVQSVLRELARAGATVVVACDDADTMVDVADRLLVMQHGRIALDGDPKTLLAGDGMLDVGAGTTDAAQLGHDAGLSSPRPVHRTDLMQLISTRRTGRG